jgi:heat shock protein HslJ
MRPRSFRTTIALAAAACGLLLAACGGGGASKPELPPVTPIMMPPPMAAQPDLVGGAWHWQGPVGGPSAPRDTYTLEFTGDGRLVVRADCNRGAGRYVIAGSDRLTLSAIATTKMGCPPGSLDTAFLRDLAEVESYRFEGEALRLATRGGGAMRFVR